MAEQTIVSTDPAGGFESHRRQVYGWAYRLLGHHHDALDVCQDVFLRWWQQQHESRAGEWSNPTSWLRRVTINRAIDLLRARKGAVTIGDMDHVPGSAMPVAPASTDELRADIARALRSLTDAQRCVLIAKVCDGLTFARIAREQDVSIPTVKTHYLRALSAVRDTLQHRWGSQS